MNKDFYQPLSANIAPKFGAPATFMRLPQFDDAHGLDACIYGLPIDWGTSARPGARFGPRQVRAESTQIRPCNMGTGAGPFSSLSIADIGDAPVNPYNLLKSINAIEAFVTEKILKHHCTPIGIGGDHTVLLPALRAIAKKHGPVCLLHVDAHSDTNDTMQGEKIAHGTPVRRAVEEGLIKPGSSAQIGLRGSGKGGHSKGTLNFGCPLFHQQQKCAGDHGGSFPLILAIVDTMRSIRYRKDHFGRNQLVSPA